MHMSKDSNTCVHLQFVNNHILDLEQKFQNFLSFLNYRFFLNIIRPPPELLPVLGPLERYVTTTLDTALLCSSRAGSHLGIWKRLVYSQVH